MLALAIEFSRCPRARTLKAEQRVDEQASINLESRRDGAELAWSELPGSANGSLERR